MTSLAQPQTLEGRPEMLQRFASALFGGNVEELSLHCQPEQEKRAEEEDEDWILVNYLGEANKDDQNGPKRCRFKNQSKNTGVSEESVKREDGWWTNPTQADGSASRTPFHAELV